MKTKLTKHSFKSDYSIEFFRVTLIALLISVLIIGAANLLYAVKAVLFN